MRAAELRRGINGEIKSSLSEIAGPVGELECYGVGAVVQAEEVLRVRAEFEGRSVDPTAEARYPAAVGSVRVGGRQIKSSRG